MSLLCSETLEDIPHILQWCPALSNVRHSLLEFTQRFSSNLPPDLFNLIRENCHPESPNFVNFVLDCSALPAVIKLTQELGPSILEPIFTVTRTWVYILHRERMKLLGRWRPVANWSQWRRPIRQTLYAAFQSEAFRRNDDRYLCVWMPTILMYNQLCETLKIN